MRNTLIAIGVLLIGIVLVFNACTKPAEFQVVSLDVTPPETTPRETVSITAMVENIGGSEGIYTVILTVDGVTVETKEVTITPGSSKMVNFSLVEDTVGTYEVGIGGLSSSLTVKEVELKYDDGQPDNSLAIGTMPGTGHLIHFSPPFTPFTITRIKIFGNLYGTGYEDLTFTVEVWDKDSKEIHNASYPHSKFSLSPGWVEIDIPNAVVNGDFYVHVFTNSPREGGVNIGYDSSVENEHSEMTRDWTIEWWGSHPQETVNWMIRVIGN